MMVFSEQNRTKLLNCDQKSQLSKLEKVFFAENLRNLRSRSGNWVISKRDKLTRFFRDLVKIKINHQKSLKKEGRRKCWLHVEEDKGRERGRYAEEKKIDMFCGRERRLNWRERERERLGKAGERESGRGRLRGRWGSERGEIEVD